MAEQPAIENVIDLPPQTEMPAATEAFELVEYIFTNNKESPFPKNLLHLFYEGCFTNTVGIMEAKNKLTGNVELLLVGLEKAEDGINTYPMARILSLEEQDNYLAPDGYGNYPGEEMSGSA